uniref:Uncharacterized protein n=1 Tax=Oryza nivara TaxID=4536 RepID=A0A0E0GHT3_ORYNI
MAMDRDANCAVQRTTELELDRKAARLEGIPRIMNLVKLEITLCKRLCEKTVSGAFAAVPGTSSACAIPLS